MRFGEFVFHHLAVKGCHLYSNINHKSLWYSILVALYTLSKNAEYCLIAPKYGELSECKLVKLHKAISA